ncbi:hypothetical protein L3Q82_018786, partial [Scortum barcoo]
AGMRVLHWCMLGVTILLLVCEVTISQLCRSLITLVDGFHTLFILMRLALPPPQPASETKPPPISLDSPVSPQHASSRSSTAAAALSCTQAATDGSTMPDHPPPPLPHCEAASLQLNSYELFSPEIFPPAVGCSLPHTSSRTHPVGTFISTLLLACLCLSYLMEIIGYLLEPHPVQLPLLLVVVGTVSLLHKMLVLRLNWDHQLQDERPRVESHVEENRKVFAEEEAKGQAEPGRVLDDVTQVQSSMDDSLHDAALVLCNPGTSSIPEKDSQTPQPPPEVHRHTAALQDSRDCEVVSSGADLCLSGSITEDNACMGHLGKRVQLLGLTYCQNASNTSPVCKSSHHLEGLALGSRLPVCLPPFVLVLQGLFTSLLALINSLAMLLISPQFLHSSGTCSLLVYLDPALSMLAVITLIAAAAPQVHRYGLLLLQATPPHICVSDLGRRIASIPGVQAVHDLHVWQLTESFTVASVHVHCYAGFPAHRCADLMSGVTKVLQSVGVSCCTVQPEFTSSSGSSTGSEGDASPVVHREDPSLPPLLACSLSCGKACAGNMCCSPQEETQSSLAPSAGETKEEPLVIENTFL